MIKKISKKFKGKLVEYANHSYFFILKLPKPIRYGAASSLIIIGGLLVVNPLTPGWLFIGIGLGIFSPRLYYKYIGRHFKHHKNKEISLNHKKELILVFSYYKTNKLKKIIYLKLPKKISKNMFKKYKNKIEKQNVHKVK